jgi:hypothetical protein
MTPTESASYLFVLFFESQYQAGDWDFVEGEALVTWQVSARKDDLNRLLVFLDRLVAGGELVYHFERVATAPASVDDVIAALERR